jgi:hypothetical protein
VDISEEMKTKENVQFIGLRSVAIHMVGKFFYISGVMIRFGQTVAVGWGFVWL